MTCLDHSYAPVYHELREMTKTNIENAMILNSKLLKSKNLEIDSKIFHFILPMTSNIKNLVNFYPNKLLGNSLKHMVNCCKDDLKINPVFFSIIDIQTLDYIYINRFENNETITNQELIDLKNNYSKSIDLISKLLDAKLSGLDFGKKFWKLTDI